MKNLFRLLFLLCALLVFSTVVHAEEPQGSVDQAITQDSLQLEQAWETRMKDDSVCFSFTLINCSEAAISRTERGALEFRFRFAQTDWSRFSILYGEDQQDGGTTQVYDPLGENTALHIRCFLWQKDGTLILCQCCELTTQAGTLMHRSLNTRTVSADQKTFSIRFESFPAEASQHEDSSGLTAKEIKENEAAAEPVCITRCWTYCSSDDRPLWQVELTGSFSGDLCESAGCVTVIDYAWSCEQAEFFPDGACAVALVTLRRYTLGVPVATQIYEFRLPPPLLE